MIGIGLSGLASGLDTEAMIQGLLQVEARPRTRLQIRESGANARVQALNDVLSRLKSLKTASTDLRSALAWGNTQKIESSNPALVGVRQTGSTVAPGAYRIDVSALANPAARTYDYAPQGADSSMSIGAYTYTVAANATVDQIAADINSDAAAPVYVTKVSDSRFTLTSRTTGATTSAAATAGGGMLTEDVALRQAGGDAAYRIDTVDYTSPSNVISDRIAGVEFTLKGFIANNAAVGISISAPQADTAKVKEKIKAFVEQYNSTVDFIRGKLKEERVANPANTTDARKGVLFGDTALSGMLRTMRQAITDTLPGDLDQLSDIGISTGAAASGALNQDSVAGKLVLDEAKLDSVLSTNLADVQTLLKGPGGFGERMEALLDPFTRSGGSMDSRVTSTQGELARIKDSMTALDRRLEATEKRFRAQFSNLERLLANSQQQGSWLNGQLAALGR